MKLREHLESLGRPLVICMTGGRDFSNASHVNEALGRLHEVYGIAKLHAGDARGADTLALLWAKRAGVESVKHEADWNRHGNSAGFIRNRAMLDEAKPDLLVAFPGGRGTEGCIREAFKRNVPVWRANPIPWRPS